VEGSILPWIPGNDLLVFKEERQDTAFYNGRNTQESGNELLLKRELGGIRCDQG
jgi:hypothetical protein